MRQKYVESSLALLALLVIAYGACACNAHAQAGRGGEWFAISGCFNTENEAARHAQMQRNAGLNPAVEASRLYPLLKRGSWVVIAGKFRTQGEAARYASFVKGKGFDCYIKRAYSP
jgi:hypothetical protein